MSKETKILPDHIRPVSEAKDQRPSLAEYDNDPDAYNRLRSEAVQAVDGLFDDPEKLSAEDAEEE